jgi:YegS/Rv2252/BmrU family lipid kinase
MKKIRFIANPLSGTNRKRNIKQLIEDHIDHEQFDYELCYTKHAGHAVALAREAAESGFYMVVACGGDGSVNEISGQLIGTRTVLGVLPCGSGNGFAMHLGIGRNVAKAIAFLNDGEAIHIDTCCMNDRTFVNLAGIGFDGVVANRLHGSRVRGFWGYLKFAIEETIRYKMLPLEIDIDGRRFRRTCLLVEVANAPIYGYGFSIVPPAKLNDGQLELLIVNRAPKWRYLLEGWRFLNASFHKSKLVECYSGQDIRVTPAHPTAVHVDGEGFDLPGPARFSIRPHSLKVMCPKVYAAQLKGERNTAVAI